MSSVIRSLMVKVGADLSDMQKGLKQASKQLKSAGKELSQIGGTLTRNLTLPIAGAGIASIKFASDLAESTNKVDVAFKGSANGVKEWSNGTLEAFGIAKGTALDMVSLFGDMGTAMGQAPEQAAKMSESLVGLSGDLASFKNISLEQAENALKGIYTGEGESLKSLGIIMQDSTLSAYALANGYKKTYSEMDQGEKIALRYAYVMETTKNAQGDFSRTSGGFANQLRMVQESFKELAATIGTELLPLITPVLQKINDLVKKFSELSPESKKSILVFAGFAAVIGPVISVIGGIVTAVSGVMAAFAAVSASVAAGGGIMAALTALLTPAGLVVAVIAALAAAAYLIISNWDAISAFFTTLWEGVCVAFDAAGVAIGKAIDWVISLPAKVVEFFKTLPYNMGVMLGEFIGKFVQFGINLGTWITTEIPKAIGKMVTFYKELPGKIWTTLTEVVAKIGNWGINMIGKIQSTIPLVITSITDFFKQLPDKMLQIGKDIVGGIWSGISSKVEWLKTQVSSFGKGITDGIKKALKIESPSKVMRDQVGKFIPAGIADGITGARGLVDKAMMSLSNGMTVSPSFEASGGSDVFGGSSTTKLYLDGRQIASATGKVQYTKNKARSRTLGVVPV